jgi:ATP-binding cassette subfamily F protein 3
MLDISGLTYRIGGRALFQNAALSVAAGQKVGFVGRNGAGKSTLFKLILGELHPDSGEISIPPRTRVGSVAQEPPGGSGSLIDWVLEQDTERAELIAHVEHHDIDPQAMADAHERLIAIDAHAAPSRAAAILAGLGFSPEAQARPASDLSGGWRMRVALAGALFARADMLLLDEPTNHLDLEATIWLQGFLKSFPGTLIIISHDRELLNAVPERIVHLDQTKLVGYGGNYDRFEQVRREKAELAAKFAAKQDEKRAHLQAFVNRFRAKASKAKQAQSRIKMIEKMGPPINVIEEQAVSFDFPAPNELPPPLIRIEKGTAGYAADKPVLSHINLRLDMDDRVALLGANGNGKSTLAKIFAGRLDLMGGEMFRTGKLRVGYFAQHQTEELDMNATPYDHMRALMPDSIPAKVRAQLGRFAFSQERADVKVSSLSGGEKARLLFALMSRDAPHLMILDEPTNHLDIDAREALVAALNEYEGAVVLISHDPHLIALTVDRLWLVADGGVNPFEGDLDDYRRLLLDRAGAARRANKAAAAERKATDAERKTESGPPRPRVNPALLRKKVQEAERRMADLAKKKAALEAKLADPTLYSGPPAAITALRRDLAALAPELAAAEAEWLAASEALEEQAAAS